jgi:formamidopyrimidine-DNA glycosylase
MPELPEVEIAARRIGAALQGAEVESTLSPGMVALKTFDPPLAALTGMTVESTGRVGKMPIVRFAGGEQPLELLIHLMSAGRLQVFDKRASLKDRASRILIRFADGRARAAPAGVRDQAARVGQAVSRGTGRAGRDGGDAGT